ncbi:Uncharacterized protein TPAR_01612 [Tolypocladium paradoxum]|uniref:FAD-binding domain-containing protein n=1 Tax=Tolypocladium paradoxum TaxID=94208 RepID=A0A2S4L6W1_9HYPO|nr:Uncharacterized protein TPAR_01612 [Tolypocladium paradoxum]
MSPHPKLGLGEKANIDGTAMSNGNGTNGLSNTHVTNSTSGTNEINGTHDIRNFPSSNNPSLTVDGESGSAVDTDFLIVGCGPAGASLACFLSSYGLKGIMVGAAPGTANTPRAHITNMAAVECLRDIGLERDINQVSAKGQCMMHTRWCHSMAGVEYARIHSWGNDPRRKASPLGS